MHTSSLKIDMYSRSEIAHTQTYVIKAKNDRLKKKPEKLNNVRPKINLKAFNWNKIGPHCKYIIIANIQVIKTLLGTFLNPNSFIKSSK